jgi:hypothetical protein
MKRKEGIKGIEKEKSQKKNRSGREMQFKIQTNGPNIGRRQ